MTIVCAPPIEGVKKTLICKGDEARVSKFHTSKGVMVERYQDFSRDVPPVSFFLSRLMFDGAECKDFFSPVDRRYFLIKYQALRLARMLFPDNFVKASSLHVQDKSCAMYSEFVPDENGAKERIRQAMKRYYSTADTKKRLRIIEETNRKEQELNPELESLVKDIEATGISLAHPEANYHISGGKTVFFEVSGIYYHRLLPHIYDTTEADRENILSHLSLLLACQMKLLANLVRISPKFKNDRECKTISYFEEASLEYICSLVYQHIFQSSDGQTNAIGSSLLGFMRGWNEFIPTCEYPGKRFRSPYYVDEKSLQISLFEKDLDTRD
jgi:hypothetical protein